MTTLVKFDTDAWSKMLVGQRHVIEEVAPFIEVFVAGLSPDDRPAGVFILAGPTGTGKTRFVETLAGMLHGDEKKMLRIDCAEYQLDHDTAKLVGAPPGYTGHKETQPILHVNLMTELSSEETPLQIILLDEIEKASGSFHRLWLGAFDKGIMKNCNNVTISFKNALIFMTSNLGSESAARLVNNRFAIVPDVYEAKELTPVPMALQITLDSDKRHKHGKRKVKESFSPEFLNRVDRILYFNPLTEPETIEVLKIELDKLQLQINTNLKEKSFSMHYKGEVMSFLVSKGYSKEYGGRELKRSIFRYIFLPLSRLLNSSMVPQDSTLMAYMNQAGDGIEFATEGQQV